MVEPYYKKIPEKTWLEVYVVKIMTEIKGSEINKSKESDSEISPQNNKQLQSVKAYN